MRLAAFQNPEFYAAQAMRLATHDKRRILSCAALTTNHIGLPRGCFDVAIDLFTSLSVTLEIEDRRNRGAAIDVSFNGGLRPDQEVAVDALLPQDIGVLAATTAFGKTVVAAWMIAERGVNVLVLVHRRHLMDQSVERLGAFRNAAPYPKGERARRADALDKLSFLQCSRSSSQWSPPISV